MKKILCMLMATILLVSSMSVAAFAKTTAESNAELNDAYNAMFESVAGDVNNDGKFDALDARSALLASVGAAEEGIRESAADMDGDGVITTIDVRALLRISAKIDSLDLLYSAADKFNLFNAFANNIKATNPRFRYTSKLQNLDMSNNNPKLIEKFNKQMNSIPGIEEKIDLGAELEKEEGKTTYKCSINDYAATETNFPVKEKDFVSALTLGDISSVTYASNKSYNFAPKRSTTGDRVQELTEKNVSMTGLDVITVTFASESMKTIPSDTTTLRHGRVFDIPQKESLTSGYEEINDMFKGLEDIIGTMNASFRNLTFHDSSVSIYFDRDTKKACVIEYNLYYDFTVNLAMDLDFFPIINIDDNMNIVDKEYSQFVYCFPNNYTA